MPLLPRERYGGQAGLHRKKAVENGSHLQTAFENPTGLGRVFPRPDAHPGKAMPETASGRRLAQRATPCLRGLPTRPAQMLGVFAEFERGIILERVNAGLARPREKGVTLGRPRAASD
jgi:hypothetical protein